MNIVKLQNDLKDLSDQQLLGTMQTGATPQYLVLAEMQRRKKMRDEASTPNEPQAQGTVADEIMSGIAQLPMQAPQMASGGLVSFAKGGYLQGEADACWKNPETGEQMCPPSKPNVEYPETGQRKSMAGGGIVALQAGGTPSEARAMLAARGIDTTGMSDEEVMGLAAANTDVPVPNVDVAEPSPMGFAPVSPDMSVAPPPVTQPEPAPKAQSGFMDKLTSGISSLLGIGDAVAAETPPDAVEAPKPPVQNPIAPIEVMKDPKLARQWLEQNAASWYEPSKRSDAQVLEDIKAYQPGGSHFEARGRGQGSMTKEQWNVENPPRYSGITMADMKAPEGWTYDAKADVWRNPEGRIATPPTPSMSMDDTDYGDNLGPAGESDMTPEDIARAQAANARIKAKYAGKNKGATDTGTTPVDQPLPDQPEGLAALISDPTMERYYDLLRQEKGVKDKSNINRYLMEMGLRMAAGKSPDFLTNLAEAGIGTLESAGKLSEEERKREEAISEEISKLLAAREVSLAKAETAQLTQLARANTRLSQISKDLEDLSLTPEKRKELEEERSMLIEYTKGLYPGGGSKYSEAGRAAAAAASFNR